MTISVTSNAVASYEDITHQLYGNKMTYIIVSHAMPALHQEFMKGVCSGIKRISGIDFMGEVIDGGQPLRLWLIGKQLIRVLCDFWMCFDGLFKCFGDILMACC